MRERPSRVNRHAEKKEEKDRRRRADKKEAPDERTKRERTKEDLAT